MVTTRAKQSALSLHVLLVTLWATTGAAAGGDTYPLERPDGAGPGGGPGGGGQPGGGGPGGAGPGVDSGVSGSGAVAESSEGVLGLPFTGAELLALVVIGVALVAAGAAALRWRRRLA